MATLGIDLGGTNARAAVVDGDGRILAAAKTALKNREPALVAQAIAHAAEEAMAAAGVRVDACGIGVAGQLVRGTGVVAVAPNLGWRNVPFGELLANALGRPVRVVNDLTAAAWGELQAGAGRGARDVYVVYVGSGVGSALIVGGQLVTGSTGVAGELGHTKVDPGGRRCGCGGQGCLEAYAGGHNLIAQMRELVAAGKGAALLEKVGGDEARLNPAVLEQVAAAGDPDANHVYERAVGYLSVSIANMITVFNPERLILGGGVLSHAPTMRRRIEEGIQRWSSETSRSAVKVMGAALGDDSGLIGAALLAESSPSSATRAVEVEDRAASAQLELLDQEIRALEDFARGVGARSQSGPAIPTPTGLLSLQAPGVFASLCERYAELIEVAVKKDAYRDVATEPSAGLRALAERLGGMGAGPRDVIELHGRVLQEKTQGAPAAKAQVVVSEGRMLALELMGHLASYYRRRATGGESSGRQNG